MKQIEATTDLEDVRNGKPFTWGQVNEIHEVGPYSIVEYYGRKRDGCTILNEIDTSRLMFSLYVGGKETCSSWQTLDEALAAGIAYRAEGANHRGNLYFMAAMQVYAKEK